MYATVLLDCKDLIFCETTLISPGKWGMDVANSPSFEKDLISRTNSHFLLLVFFHYMVGR